MATDRSLVAADPPVEVSPWLPRYRAVTLGMVALIALSAFESLAVTTTMPAVVAALGGLSLYAMAFAAPIAAGVVGMVAAGGWADRRGPARPLLAGVGLFAAGLVVAGTAPVMATVVAGRAIQGLGSGLLTVALYVMVARVYPDSVRPRVFASFAAAWVVPSVVGPALAGLVAERLGWRWVFLAVPVLALPAVLALRPALSGFGRAPAQARPTDDDEGTDDPVPGTPTDPEAPRRPAVRESRRLLWGVGAGVGALVLHWGGQQSGTRAVLAVVVGLGLLAPTVPALLPAGTLRAARGLPTVILVRGLVGAAFFGAEVYLPLLFVTERGLSPATAGLALTSAALLWSLGSWMRGRQEGHWPDTSVLRASGGALALGIGLAALGVWSAVPVAVSLVGWGVAGFGMGLGYPTLSLLTLRLSAPAEQGAHSSALQVNESVTIAVVLAVSGPLFVALIDRSASAAFLACFAVAAALALAATSLAGRVRVGP